MPSERTAEIWSTRLQRELVALTSGDASDGKDTVGVLPPFVTVQDHTIDIERGLCDVTFRVRVEGTTAPAPAATESEGTEEKAAATESEEKEEKDGKEEGAKEEGTEGGAATAEAAAAADTEKEEAAEGGGAAAVAGDGAAAEAAAEEGTSAAPAAAPESTDEPPKAEEESKEKEDQQASSSPAEEEAISYVTIMLDASMGRKDDGTPDLSPTSYPFQAPVAIVEGGAELFPPGSDIKNGDYVDIDLDWTPSLHLNDAMLNIGLKVRESILMGEAFYAAAGPDGEGGAGDGPTVGAGTVMTAKKVGSFFNSLKQQGISMAAAAAEVAAPTAQGLASERSEGKKKEKSPRKSPPQQQRPKQQRRDDGTVRIGDEMDLSQSPWNVCSGMYSCKAIRRPDFVVAEIARAEEEAKAIMEEDQQQQVAGAGFSGAGSLFSSFKNSAKSVLEESFLMINDEHIVEMKTNKFSVGTGKVSFAIPISFLSKLKFRREESISLFFKQSPDDPLIYMCPESADCVKQIQSVLKRHGVKGKHTNAAMQRSIQIALQIVVDIQKKEKALEENPTVERVNEIMDLYRQAAEKFEQAGDARHEEVMIHMRKFLAKPLTASILDGSYAEKKENQAPATPSLPTSPPRPVPQGEVLEASKCMLNDHEDEDADEKEAEAKSGCQIMKQTDDIIEEAKRDMEELGGDSDLDDLFGSSGDSGESGEEQSADAIAELDAMLSAADKELADLMNA